MSQFRYDHFPDGLAVERRINKTLAGISGLRIKDVEALTLSNEQKQKKTYQLTSEALRILELQAREAQENHDRKIEVLRQQNKIAKNIDSGLLRDILSFVNKEKRISQRDLIWKIKQSHGIKAGKVKKHIQELEIREMISREFVNSLDKSSLICARSSVFRFFNKF